MPRHFLIGLALTTGAAALGSATASAPTYGYGSPVSIYGYGPAQPWSFGYAASPMCGSGRYPSHEFRSPAYGYGDVGAWGARYVGLA